MPARQTLEEALRKFVPDRPPDKCWPAVGGGYNKVGWHVSWKCDGVRWLAHRAAYTVFVGPIPDGVCVLHHCDNPRCCNPAHLFLGTRADNVADMWGKGRQGPRKGRPGVKTGPSPTRRLTSAQAFKAFDLYLAGRTQRQIANMFNVTDVAVGFVLRGVTYPEIARTHEVAHLLGRKRRADCLR